MLNMENFFFGFLFVQNFAVIKPNVAVRLCCDERVFPASDKKHRQSWFPEAGPACWIKIWILFSLALSLAVSYRAGTAEISLKTSQTSGELWGHPDCDQRGALAASDFQCWEATPNKVFPCMKATYPYAVKNQRKGKKYP